MAAAATASAVVSGRGGVQGQDDLESLLNILLPKPAATEVEEQMRINLIMQQAVKGQAVPAHSEDLDQDAADRLKALSILQGVFGNALGLAKAEAPSSSGAVVTESASSFPFASEPSRSGGKDIAVASCAAVTGRASSLPFASEPSRSGSERVAVGYPSTSFEDSQEVLSSPGGEANPVHEQKITIEGLDTAVRLLEVVSSEAATKSYKSDGESDPFGSKTWPTSYLVARRLLAEGVVGRSVLELGCGTGLISIAALLGGASFVMATDRAQANLERARASAQLNGRSDLHAELFDVTLSLPLPSQASPLFGNSKGAPYRPSCADKLPTRHFDFVVFSDVLYWPMEAEAFGRRAAEAYVAGATVIIADPGRRRDDFLRGLRSELERLGSRTLPSLDLMPAPLPPCVFEWVSAEVRTASKLFCRDPFEVILRPAVEQTPASLIKFEVVD